MYEDYHLDDTFSVELASDLLSEEDPDMVHRLMTPCQNCGELRPRDDPSIMHGGICHLCSLDDAHASIRARSENAGDNLTTLANVVKEWRDMQ